MNSPPSSFGTIRERAASVSYAEIEAAARKIMAAGEYPSVQAVRVQLDRGSTTTIHEAMGQFWKDQAASNVANPVALTRLPPEFADAAVTLWEQALRLSLQTARQDDNAAQARLEGLKRETETRARSLELREKEWDMAARIRERALTDARAQVNVLLTELGNTRADLRAREVRIADLEVQLEEHRRQSASVIANAAARPRAKRSRRKSEPASRPKPKKRVASGSTRLKVKRRSIN